MSARARHRPPVMGERHLAPADAADAEERVRALLRRYCLRDCAEGSGVAVLRYTGARVLFDQGTVRVAPADGSPAVALFLAWREALSPDAASFLGATPVDERWTGRGIALRKGEVRVNAAGLSACSAS